MAKPDRTPTPTSPPPRRALVAHIREQLEADPDRYANPAKLQAVAENLSRVWAREESRQADRLAAEALRHIGGGE